MSLPGILLTLATVGLLLALPKWWAPLPFFINAALIPFSQEMEVGPVHLTGIRFLVAAGLLRMMTKGDRLTGGLIPLDKWMILWAFWFAVTSVFHDSSALMTRLGEIFNDVGIYFLFRIYIQNVNDILRLFKMTCVVVVPLAVVMLCEKFTGTDYFGVLFGGFTESLVRNGHVRAQGPFEHPIMAGTVGAVCLPMALYLWRQQRKLALIGMAAAGSIVVASASSGPVMTAFSIFGGMAMWKIRNHLRVIRWLFVGMLVALNFIMNDPVYFLVARIDISGGSTGWYRAQLIRRAIEQIGQWWFAGTDYTRNWMLVEINKSNTDITNYYIRMGVWGGLLLMFIFIAILYAAFAAIGRTLRSSEAAPFEFRFLYWVLGSILFGHAVTFFSVSYFDQTVVFFYMLLAVIGSISAVTLSTAPSAVMAADQPAIQRPATESSGGHG